MKKPSKQPKKEPGRVSVYLDLSTLKRLDLIVKHVPEVSSRSGAIRYAARVIAERLEVTG